MADKTISQLVMQANAVLKSSLRNTIVVPPNSPLGSNASRFDVYHSGLSLCSQKVRFALAELGVPYKSHDLDLVSKLENYSPEYVKLRLAAVTEDVTFADGFSGSTSVTVEGFDSCVVPTLVDHEAQKVVVDSANIVKYLARVHKETVDLLPSDLVEKIEEHVKVVDQAPHAALLYGANPEGDTRPWILRRKTQTIHEKKIKILEANKARVSSSSLLTRVYDAKISKEQAASTFVSERESMSQINERLLKGLSYLEAELEQHGKSWACGEKFTIADILWGVSLFRMKWIGVGHLFSEHSTCPLVHEYSEQLFARDAFRRSVMLWPLAYMPSPHVPELNTTSHYMTCAWQFILRNKLRL